MVYACVVASGGMMFGTPFSSPSEKGMCRPREYDGRERGISRIPTIECGYHHAATG